MNTSFWNQEVMDSSPLRARIILICVVMVNTLSGTINRLIIRSGRLRMFLEKEFLTKGSMLTIITTKDSIRVTKEVTKEAGVTTIKDSDSVANNHNKVDGEITTKVAMEATNPADGEDGTTIVVTTKEEGSKVDSREDSKEGSNHDQTSDRISIIEVTIINY